MSPFPLWAFTTVKLLLGKLYPYEVIVDTNANSLLKSSKPPFRCEIFRFSGSFAHVAHETAQTHRANKHQQAV